MATTSTTELGLIKPTPGTKEPYAVANENSNSDKIDALFNASTGHAHDGAHKGAPITASSLTNLTVTGAKIAAATITGDKLSLGPITAQLSAAVTLNNTGTYFDGPSIAQGSTGTWWVSGTVTCQDTTGAAQFRARLWDGTTIIADGVGVSGAANVPVSIALSGYLATPAGNLRISVEDASSTAGQIMSNPTGTGNHGSTISAFRIA